MNYGIIKENNVESDWLFVIKRDKEWGQANVANANAWCDIISKYLGRTFYSHSARHRYVTMMKESKLPDSVIVELVGWKKGSGDMLALYNDTGRLVERLWRVYVCPIFRLGRKPNSWRLFL